MKVVYELNFEMFDGEDWNKWNDIYEDIDDARLDFTTLKEEYKDFWECFDTVEDELDSIRAFDMGWYDNGHFEMYIIEKEMK